MNKVDTQTQTPAASAEVMFSLLHAAHTLEARIEAALASEGLSSAKYGALSQLAKAGEPLPLSELAARLSCVRSNMTQLIDRLEADGLVRRVADPTDRRIVRAGLTPVGEKRHAAGTRQMEQVQAAFAASLPEADRAAFVRVLSALK